MNESGTIFVVGFPRSGTTWLANILNAHPDTVYRHEIFGRDFNFIGDALFEELKKGRQLPDKEYQNLYSRLLQARTSTDKPPFFKKNWALIKSPKVQQFFWLGCKSVPFLSPLYRAFFSGRKSARLVVKETRSSVNLLNIIDGIRSDHILIIVRNPFSTIASNLKGIRSGDMGPPSESDRTVWLNTNKVQLEKLGKTFNKEDVLNWHETEFFAWRWFVQNSDYMAINQERKNALIIPYDEVLKDKSRWATQILSFCGLKTSEQVNDFLTESSSNKMTKSVMSRDASSDYYSVYRDKNFDPEAWRKVLDEQDIKFIETICVELFDQITKG